MKIMTSHDFPKFIIGFFGILFSLGIIGIGFMESPKEAQAQLPTGFSIFEPEGNCQSGSCNTQALPASPRSEKYPKDEVLYLVTRTGVSEMELVSEVDETGSYLLKGSKEIAVLSYRSVDASMNTPKILEISLKKGDVAVTFKPYTHAQLQGKVRAFINEAGEAIFVYVNQEDADLAYALMNDKTKNLKVAPTNGSGSDVFYADWREGYQPCRTCPNGQCSLRTRTIKAYYTLTKSDESKKVEDGNASTLEFPNDVNKGTKSLTSYSQNYSNNTGSKSEETKETVEAPSSEKVVKEQTSQTASKEKVEEVEPSQTASKEKVEEEQASQTVSKEKVEEKQEPIKVSEELPPSPVEQGKNSNGEYVYTQVGANRVKIEQVTYKHVAVVPETICVGTDVYKLYRDTKTVKNLIYKNGDESLLYVTLEGNGFTQMVINSEIYLFVENGETSDRETSYFYFRNKLNSSQTLFMSFSGNLDYLK